VSRHPPRRPRIGPGICIRNIDPSGAIRRFVEGPLRS
jgi:hypothetical protein